MDSTTKDFLNLLFNEGETICVSDCQGGYHSVEQELDSITLVSPKEEKPNRVILEKDINLVAINPINGFRRDKNVTNYRTFLIELDEGELVEQKRYIEELKMPYSICVFSGNKSLHYGIVLETDLINENDWRYINKWILNIVNKADQQTLNPSRSIRFPENIRKDGRKLKQALVDKKERVKEEDLYIWLNKHPDKIPKPKREKKKVNLIDVNNRFELIPFWMKEKLMEGVDSDRNNTWYNLSCCLAKIGYVEDDIEVILDPYFQEDSDFNRTEWLGCIKSGVNTVLGE